MKTKSAPPKKSWFEVRNVTGGRAEISIMDEIGMFGVTAADFKDAVDDLPPTQPILLRLHTPGGDITEGNEIHNILKEHPGGVEVECGALVASIGTVVAMAGKPITMPQNGFFMIHDPFVLTMGGSDDLRKDADTLDKMKDGIIAMYAAKTGKTPRELDKMMSEETWMTADEALENGFIDSIRTDTVTDYVNFSLSKFKNSANFALRLQKQSDPAKELAGGKGGDTSASVTLSDLEDAFEGKANNAAPPASPVHPNTLPKDQKTTVMPEEPTVEQKTAAKAEQDRLIQRGIEEGIKAHNKRCADIDEIVESYKNRYHVDFSDMAGKAKQDNVSAADFSVAISKAEGKKIEPQNVIGGGPEHVEVVNEFRGRNVTKGSPGEQFVNSESYKHVRDAFMRGSRNTAASARTSMFTDALRAAGIQGAPTEQNSSDGIIVTGFKNVVTDSGLISQQDVPGVFQLGVRQLKVKDVLMGGVTNSIAIRYIRETAFVNSAAMVPEGTAKPYGSIQVSQQTATVQKIAALIKVTDELWSDFPAVASLINLRLPYMAERTEEDQLLNGDGTGSNLSGLLLNAGLTRAVGTDTRADAIFKAIMLVMNGPGLQTGGYPVDYIIMNPISWQDLRLAKDANNQYFGGGPFTAAYGNGPLVTYDSFWGRPVVVTPAIAAGTALVGSRLAAQYFMKMGMMIESTNCNTDDFEKNLLTIRAEERLTLIVPLPLGLCTVTGLATT